ncbi:MAG: hypothetical protein AAF184_19655 [Pseudomonadota bacterium]
MQSDQAGEIREDLVSTSVQALATLAAVVIFSVIAWVLRTAEGGASAAALNFSNGFMLLAIAQLVPPSSSGFWLQLITGRRDFPGATGFTIVVGMAYVGLTVAGAMAFFDGVKAFGAAP